MSGRSESALPIPKTRFYALPDNDQPRGLVVCQPGFHQYWNWSERAWSSKDGRYNFVFINGWHGDGDPVTEGRARQIARRLGIPWTWATVPETPATARGAAIEAEMRANSAKLKIPPGAESIGTLVSDAHPFDVEPDEVAEPSGGGDRQ
jgi:hypothetical protein